MMTSCFTDATLRKKCHMRLISALLASYFQIWESCHARRHMRLGDQVLGTHTITSKQNSGILWWLLMIAHSCCTCTSQMRSCCSFMLSCLGKSHIRIFSQQGHTSHSLLIHAVWAWRILLCSANGALITLSRAMSMASRSMLCLLVLASKDKHTWFPGPLSRLTTTC